MMAAAVFSNTTHASGPNVPSVNCPASAKPVGVRVTDVKDSCEFGVPTLKARAALGASAEEFTAKALHQKPEVLKLTVLETRENVVIVQAEGQLVRTGLVGGQVFGEAAPFTVRFQFARNPNLAANGRYPLAVWTYDVSS